MELWELDSGDFEENHPDYRLSRIYKLWFEYIKLSPSIALAHKHLATKKGLTPEEFALVPVDFDQVLQVYQDFRLREVFNHHISFKVWWQLVAEDLFGIHLAVPAVTPIIELSSSYEISSERLLSTVEHFFNEQLLPEQERGFGHLILSVPLTGNKGELLRQISDLLQFERCKIPISTVYGRYKLTGERVHIDPLKVGLRMLWIRAAEPQIKRWRLGVMAEVSEKYAHLNLDPNEISQDDKTARKIMGITTQRAFKKAMFVMENSARGRFPCSSPVTLPVMDWLQLHQRIHALKHKQELRIRHERIKYFDMIRSQ